MQNSLCKNFAVISVTMPNLPYEPLWASAGKRPRPRAGQRTWSALPAPPPRARLERNRRGCNKRGCKSTKMRKHATFAEFARNWPDLREICANVRTCVAKSTRKFARNLRPRLLRYRLFLSDDRRCAALGPAEPSDYDKRNGRAPFARSLPRRAATFVHGGAAAPCASER